MITRTWRLAALSILAALAAACSDSATAPAATDAVASVAVAPADLSLEVGADAPLSATPRRADGSVAHGRTVVWSSSDSTVAAVTSGGKVRARRPGSATIRAVSEGKAGTVVVTVRERPATERPVAWISITPSGGVIPQAIGTSRQLGVVARAQDGTEITGRPVVWSSSHPAVASVGATGLLQAHSAGTSWVTAVVDGRRDSTLVSVPSLIDRIETDPAELALGIGDASTVVATALDAHGAPLPRTLAWSSTNIGVATVDASGRVVATGAGSALIVVTSEGKQATTRVTVTGQQWHLIRSGGDPLPATLYTTTTTVGGAERTTVFQVTGGTIRMRDGRYKLRLQGWLMVDGAAPVSTTIASDGVVAYDVTTGAPMFFESDDWWNREPRFRSRLVAGGRFELDWSREANGPVVPLVFAP